MGRAATSAVATVLLVIAGCGDTTVDGDGVARYRLEPVAEPEALPYRFEVVRNEEPVSESGRRKIQRYLPLGLDSTGK